MDHIFRECCEILFNNRIICQHSATGCYEYLSLDVNRERLSDHLRIMGYGIGVTSDRQGYFLSYENPEDSKVQSRIKSQFQTVANDLETIVNWLRLCSSTSPTGRPIAPGDIISESEMLASIENSKAQRQALIDIAESRYVNSRSKDIRGMLQAVIRKLTDTGFFVAAGNTGLRHRATGQWSWLYDVMGFIRTHECLPDDETGTEQMDLM